MTLDPPIFVMTPELQAVLDALPEDSPRSRLEPFRTFILRWRNQGRSYRRIQQILADECKVRVTHETLRRFIKRRVRPRRINPEVTPEVQPVEIQPVTNDPYAESRARMKQHRSQPAAAKPAKLFEYTDEDAVAPIVFKKEK